MSDSNAYQISNSEDIDVLDNKRLRKWGSAAIYKTVTF